MDLCFNTTLANPYKSASQKIRIMSEAWVAEHMYCPCCGNERIVKLSNNRPVADFFCENCQEIFELKSKNGLIGKKIADGAYETMIERITSNQTPSLLILQYADLCVRNLHFIPKHFLHQISSKSDLLYPLLRNVLVGLDVIFYIAKFLNREKS